MMIYNPRARMMHRTKRKLKQAPLRRTPEEMKTLLPSLQTPKTERGIQVKVNPFPLKRTVRVKTKAKRRRK